MHSISAFSYSDHPCSAAFLSLSKHSSSSPFSRRVSSRRDSSISITTTYQSARGNHSHKRTTTAPRDMASFPPRDVSTQPKPRGPRAMLGVTSAFLFLATACVLLRAWVKLKMLRSWGWDDWAMAVTLVRSLFSYSPRNMIRRN